MHEVEISGNPNEINREELLSLIHTLGADMSLLMEKDVAIDRARDLISGGIKAADAMHVAYAEAAGADFITCDDALIKKCKRHDINVWYGLPSDFVAKERIA
jgi:predicted nucleic acid-binding protein